MTGQGRVGPEHARRAATLELLRSGAPTHDLSQERVAVGPGYRLFRAVPKAPPPPGAGRCFTCSMAMPPSIS